MLHLTIDKKFLEDYRQYKLDLLDNKVEVNFEYTALAYLLDSKKNNLSDLLERTETYDRVTIDVTNGDIVRESFNTASFKDKLNELLSN